jgi:hypothetical protein
VQYENCGRCAISWVAIAVSVGTAVVGAYEQRQVAHKQDSQLAAQLRQQAASEDKAKQRTQQFIQQQQGQTDVPQKTAAAKQYQTALDANKGMSTQSLANVGNVSDAYKKAGSDAALGISSYGQNLGNLTASIDAPGLQRQQNQRNIGDFGIDVNRINRRQSGQDFLDQMKLNSIHANPYVSMALQAARAYAGAKAGSAGASGGGGADPWSGGGYDSMPNYSGYA